MRSRYISRTLHLCTPPSGGVDPSQPPPRLLPLCASVDSVEIDTAMRILSGTVQRLGPTLRRTRGVRRTAAAMDLSPGGANATASGSTRRRDAVVAAVPCAAVVSAARCVAARAAEGSLVLACFDDDDDGT